MLPARNAPRPFIQTHVRVNTARIRADNHPRSHQATHNHILRHKTERVVHLQKRWASSEAQPSRSLLTGHAPSTPLSQAILAFI